MLTTRRQWFSLVAASAVASIAPRLRAQRGVPAAVTRRIADAIRAYETQGFHRTATAVDNASGEWLADQVTQAGLSATLESFPVDRVDPITCTVTIANRRIDGLPLFDGRFTTAEGIRGTLGVLGSGAEIGLGETAVNASSTGALGDARRSPRHQAIVTITRGRRPGLCPSNADFFLKPFGPPVLQVSSTESAWLADQARQGAAVHVVAHAGRTAATATNVIAEIAGINPALGPLVVMTPRSGWYSCGSERGGGIACWLEIMRELKTANLRRTVLFVASSGHELGHLGIDSYIERRAGIVTRAIAWLHLGANIGAATDLGNNLLQASEDDLDSKLTGALTSVGLGVARRAPRGRVPSGEAEAVHRGGGRYVSMIGGNALFHHVDDHGPQATDPAAIARFSAAFVDLARSIAAAD